ncbi:uncharacterized protein LOC116357456 [Oncorhynchus kisutch]|uniref:uncharacterized protein LOC116357456 n=1 Tax=Oncorhynchus kisutch TaxID=8019 RepID=UPI0012DF012E|nr:uncharacterized protein LOC116357456 [Oncorhynchus kisutch]
MASFLDQASLLKTAAIEKVVAPIAVHLVHLVLLCERAEGLEGPEQFTQLEGEAQAVARATMNMAAVAYRRSEASDDEVMRTKMSSLVEPMTVSGQHVLLAAQKLSIQPSLAEHREELITATQNVLLGVVKILSVEDDATVRKTIAAADWVLDCLSSLASSLDILSLLKAFHRFTEALILLNNLVVERAEALQDPRQTEHLHNSLDSLKKCISMLHTAMVTTIKHRTSEQAQAAKTYILDRVKSTVKDIVTTLKSYCRRGGVALGPCGYYIDRRDALIRLLASSSSSSSISNVDSLLRDLVFHCMVVANSSQRELQHCVVDHCRHVLHLWSEMSRLVKLPENPDDDNLNQHLQSICFSLMQQIQNLDSAMMTAVLYQVLDTFVTGSSPLEDLVNMVGQVLENDSVEELPVDPVSIRVLLMDLLTQADRMIQVASFISAFATDSKSLENVENSRACLTRLKAEIEPLALELDKDGSDLENCFEAVQKLHDLCERWEEETGQLQDALCDIIDVREFTSLAVHEMANDQCGCDAAYKAQNHKLFRKHADDLISHTKQVVHSVRRHVDKSDNPIYRNGLLVLLKQVEVSQAKVVGSLRDMCSGSSLDVNVYSVFSDQAFVVIQHFRVLREGLDGQQHPHLLSPLREAARQSIVSSSVQANNQVQGSAMDQEIRDLGLQFPVLDVSERDSPVEYKVEFSEKEIREPMMVDKDFNDDLKGPAVSGEANPIPKPLDFDLLPLLYKVVTVTKEKDVTVLSKACTGVLKLSNCYAQAVKEASTIVDAVDSQTLDIFRSELVALTPQLVQTAQETAMSLAMSTDSLYKHSTLFSDLINNIRKVLLPAAGTWYHAVYSMFQGRPRNMAAPAISQELSKVMSLCADVVQLLTSSDITPPSDSQESFTVLHSKLIKAHNNTRELTELASSSTSGQADQIEGPCILWALSVQVLLNSLDKILGTRETLMRQLTPQKRLAAMSENSLRIQEAARLTSVNCKSAYKVKTLTQLQGELKTLTEAYLQVAEDLCIVSLSGILQFARSEVLQRQLLIKMRVLSGHLNKANTDYVTAIQNIVNIAYKASKHHKDNKTSKEAQETFETAAEKLFENAKAATKRVEDCFNYIRNPRARINLRSINDHLSFQISDIVSRARLVVETHCIYDTLSLEIQIQCWSAKAHFLAEEIYKVDGLSQEAKEHVKVGLQGGTPGDCKEGMTESNLSPTLKKIDYQPDIAPWQTTNPENINTTEQNSSICGATLKYEPAMATKQYDAPRSAFFRDTLSLTYLTPSLTYTTITPSLTYTALFLKQETDRWDARGNRIVQVTREIADQIYHMAQYLRRKGPILSKEMFVNTAKGVVSNCQYITHFVRVISNHCLDKQCTAELSLRVEQILTITNQLTIISSVNALTPGSKSSDEILVKNAQNLLQIVLHGVRAAETACIKGLKQPEPNSDGVEAAELCFQWKRNLQIHRAQQNCNSDTDDLGLRRTSQHRESPSLAPPIHIQKQGFK